MVRFSYCSPMALKNQEGEDVTAIKEDVVILHKKFARNCRKYQNMQYVADDMQNVAGSLDFVDDRLADVV